MTLGNAQAKLQEAKDELMTFAAEHPERMDATIADAMDMAASAADMLDSDFYTEHDADPAKLED